MSDPNQVIMVSLDQLVTKDHSYRKMLSMINFPALCKPLKKYAKESHTELGYGIHTLFKTILLQFMEDLSDRELEKYLQENISAKLFCGFQLADKTPHFTLFGKVRERIGTHRLSKMFTKIKASLKKQGYLSEVFTFVDSTHLTSKFDLGKERDRAAAARYEEFNNEVLKKVGRDKQASIGSKGKNKFWYGFKKHVSVDMQSGLINKVAITSANLTDAKGLKHICPNSGAVYGDKGYCLEPARKEIQRRGCHDATIKRNNMKGKNREKDRWHSGLRSPYERVFSKSPKRVRYEGIAKNMFSEICRAMVFNLKRVLVLSKGSSPQC